MEKVIKKANKPDIKKVISRNKKTVTNVDLIKNAGIWAGTNITLEKIREKVWVRK